MVAASPGAIGCGHFGTFPLCLPSVSVDVIVNSVLLRSAPPDGKLSGMWAHNTHLRLRHSFARGIVHRTVAGSMNNIIAYSLAAPQFGVRIVRL